MEKTNDKAPKRTYRCNDCGAEIKRHDVFCPKCGKKLDHYDFEND